MSPTIILAQTLSTSIVLIASGGIASLSLFDLPILQSQPASRSLPSTRWLFSRGSHIFPPASLTSALGFLYLSFLSLGPSRSLGQALRIMKNGGSPKVYGYLAAAILSFSIGPFTQLAMIPTNFQLIEMNEKKGGKRSARSALESDQGGKMRERKAIDSVNGEGEGAESTDLSGPQERTEVKTTKEDDARARTLLKRFETLNAVRAGLIGAGGIVGLVTALL
ncbi:uncharacterized protein LY89DRAFT_688378 [Mollisia scopiformis]|uniref:DUF1772-domain-containing protein n=1 Tax=Mollisia scopiformis TaxID=149040 RepID=A0A194WWD5_MOLSC|nr:uncharacterized protein LY89DRAFT_688378 [Mollisia scopiformis]KUJ11892.1 hypothetical protein LY89DRAFT_688378 [Mollisia scopiformis]